MTQTSDTIYDRSLVYHREPTHGKISIVPTKPLVSQEDLSLAYSPGVAGPCLKIQEDPSQAAYLTSRGNLIAIITNGTAVLGLGNIGPLAAKPVMEGKCCLFKKFGDIDAIDIEINEMDPDKLIDIIASLEPSFGGINLEDIKAPECFYIEKKLSQQMNIPVFHDDQHGTAIIVCAAILNGLQLVGKEIQDVRLTTSGAGAAAIACLDLLVEMGVRRENIIVSDRSWVVFEGREGSMDEYKARYATKTSIRTLHDALQGADIFLGLSAANVVTQEMILGMAKNPLILALANPEPEILPELVLEVRSDAIIATGRSDYPNQVNNVLCFPYIFRGALDVGATKITAAMKIACIKALAKLAQAEGSDVVSSAYGGEIHKFGTNYIIPKPFDPRLSVELPLVVAQAAMDSGVAVRPILDMDAYRHELNNFVYRSSLLMRPIFDQARKKAIRVSFAEGEDERVLRAVQTLCDEGICRPILIGRPNVIQMRIERLGLRLKEGQDFDMIDPNNDSRYLEYWTTYHKIMERKGVSPDAAKIAVRTNTSIIAALTVHMGHADTMIAGTARLYHENLRDVLDILELSPECDIATALGVLMLDQRVVFMSDPFVNENPNAEEIATITLLAAEQVKRFGLKPRVGLLSHSNFGSSNTESAIKMRKALEIIRERDPELEVDGEMQADSALSSIALQRVMSNSTLTEQANLLIMPNIDSANIAFNMAKVLANGLSIGPILMGTDKPGHIVNQSISVRGLINMAALAAVDAQVRMEKKVG